MGEELLQELYNAVLDGEYTKARMLSQKALDQGIPARKVLLDTLVPAIATVTEKSRRKEHYITEIMWSARAFSEAAEVLTLALEKKNPRRIVGYR